MQQMTPKERWLAALQMRPVDRLPFWPKLDAAYPRAQEPPFCRMENDAIHDWIGSDKHTWISGGVKEIRTNTSVDTTTSGKLRRTAYHTPYGDTERIDQFDEASQAFHPIQFPVETTEDIRRMTAFYADATLEPDRDGLDQIAARAQQVGQDALLAQSIGESPLMHWVEWTAGVERAHLLLADHQAEVEELFAAMHEVLLQKTAILTEHSAADVLYMIENTSTTLISPYQYRTYCYEHIRAYGELARSNGRLMALHMCGHLKLLLPDLTTLPVEAFEAFTSPTLGNTTLLDGRAACPDKCLVGGTNAMLWTKSADEIVEQIERDLNALPHHRGIAITSAGVMPPLCKPQTIREVCTRVKRYPAIVSVAPRNHSGLP
jgi:uroporphyrinogen-III decarboxylase